MTRLSKSRFIAGQQCPLRLWNDVYRRDLATPPDATLQTIFDRGTAVGELAQQRWPGGVLVGFKPWEREQAIAATNKLMADPAVPAIYEAAIEHQGVFIRVDILARNGAGWDLIEVKAATRGEKEVFQEDIAIQHWVATGAGLDIRQAGILVLDRNYVYPGGEYDLDQLFAFFESREHCLAASKRIGEQVRAFHDMLTRPNPPEIPIGDHCFTPYECPYYAHCSDGIEFPENGLDQLHRLHPTRRAELQALGIERIENIPADFNLNQMQERIRQAVITGQPWQSGKLGETLAQVEWPLYYLDFEAFQPALPRYPGTRPFQAIPFQFSLHYETPKGELQHMEHLHTEDSDPRPALAHALVHAVGDTGSIVVYSGYERRMLNELAVAVPELATEIETVKARLWDLLPVVRENYYHPDFNGSFSIKAVLPALLPDRKWSDLAISDGMAAATAYEAALNEPTSADAQQTFEQLRSYCAQDTQAMVDVLNELRERAPNRPN
ncbi:DUF2779 domain-containing protein [Wenzhouxiangella sediminis]|uniref:DUF2779 domain-containing protein n=1 Tax=Wenzhouxiangella sediminis TaxID=1792836 RepID=A0A3E1K635_9GAMM|nr:DUF2779 domain-containing protein [Wenzhouxiangella sediminis]RFF29410.1 DUF2779 domain-containing protein [Wenzhouxiangella sediminis]